MAKDVGINIDISSYGIPATPAEAVIELERAGLRLGAPDGYSYATGEKKQPIPEFDLIGRSRRR